MQKPMMAIAPMTPATTIPTMAPIGMPSPSAFIRAAAGAKGDSPGGDGSVVRGGEGSGEDGGVVGEDVKTIGITAEATETEEVASTVTPRLEEMALAGCATRAVAAAVTAVTVVLGVGVAEPPVAGASGMVRMTVTSTLEPDRRSAM